MPTFLVVSWFATREVEGFVPVSGRTVAHLGRFRQVLRAEVAIVIVGLAASLLDRRPWFAKMTVAALFAAVVTAWIESACSVGARLDPTGRWVQLTHVHPGFRDVVDHLDHPGRQVT